MKKVQWNSINKKQNGIEQSKNEKASTLPEFCSINDDYNVYELKHNVFAAVLVQYEWRFGNKKTLNGQDLICHSFGGALET